MKSFAAVCAIGVWMAGSAYGHHSGAGFERDKSVTLEGTVLQFKWANPHSWIEIEVPNEQGGSRVWNVEMTAPAQLVRAGWKSSIIKPGDKVSIVARPLQNGEPGGLFVSLTLADGRTLTDRPATPPGN